MHYLFVRTVDVLAHRWRDITSQDRERGLTTTEVAVLTFILVAIAVAIGALIWTYAEGQVGDLPGDTAPGVGS